MRYLIFLIFLLFFALTVWPVAAAPPKQAPTQKPSLAQGAALWTENCAPCHGAAGKGDGPAAASIEFPLPDFTNPKTARTRTLAEMFAVTKEGRMERFMPPWRERLTDAQIWDVVAYAQSLSISPADLEAGAVIYAESCAECHGQDGVADGIDFSQPDFMVNTSRQALFDQLRAAEGEHDSLGDLSDEALWQSLVVAQTFSLEMELDLAVFETTDNPTAISQKTLHRIISFGSDQMSVADVYVFSNSGDRTFIGRQGPDGLPETVKIGVPAEAIEVSFRANTVRPAGDGVYIDSQPVPPGEDSYTVFVTYFVPFQGSKKRLETPFFYNVEMVNVLAVDQGELISSPQLDLLDIQSFQGVDYLRLVGTNLEANKPLVMEFDRLDRIELAFEQTAQTTTSPARTTGRGLDQGVLRWSVLGLGVLVTAFSIFFAARRQSQPVTQNSLAGEKTRLLTLLNELETLHRAGELDEQTYRRIKQKNRALLKQVLAQLND